MAQNHSSLSLTGKCVVNYLYTFTELSRAKNIYNTVCGFNRPPPPRRSKEELAEIRRKLTDIDEDPFWEKVCDINAVIAVAITCFIIGFYA